MKIFNFVLRFDLVLLLNIHFNTGILDKKGVPELSSLCSTSSSPPSIIISLFFTLIIDSNCRVAVAGGALVVTVPVKLESSTFISSVTCSSPETKGLI